MARYFGADEFVRASSRKLSVRELGLASWWGDVLDPVRAVAGALWVTSFVRAGDNGSHGDGSAVDIQPVAGGERRIEAIAALCAALLLRSGAVAQVIYEAPERGQLRGHVHIARRLVGGASGGYLVDRRGDRKYELAVIPSRVAAEAAAAPGLFDRALGRVAVNAPVLRAGRPVAGEGGPDAVAAVRPGGWHPGRWAVAAGAGLALLSLARTLGVRVPGWVP